MNQDQADALIDAGAYDDTDSCSFCKEVISQCHCRTYLLNVPVTREAVERGVEK